MVTAGIVEAEGDQVLHAQFAHVAERARRTGAPRGLGAPSQKCEFYKGTHRLSLVCSRVMMATAHLGGTDREFVHEDRAARCAFCGPVVGGALDRCSQEIGR